MNSIETEYLKQLFLGKNENILAGLHGDNLISPEKGMIRIALEDVGPDGAGTSRMTL